MAEKFSFFDPVEDESGVFDREYNAQEFTDYFASLVTTGVMKGAGNQLSVSADGSSMITKLNTGVAFVEGRYYANDSLLNHTHDTETVGKSRIDRIVIRLDLSTEARHVKSFVKKGVASAVPVSPVLTQTANVYEISVAQVKVVGGQTFISASNVTDERGKDVICPWAGSKILPSFDDNALSQHIDDKLLHKQGTNISQIGSDANAEGMSTIAGSTYAHAEGVYSTAMQGQVIELSAFDNIAKTVTLLSAPTNLVVGNTLVARQSSGVAKAYKVKSINGLVIGLDTTATLDSTFQLVIIPVTGTPYPTHAEGQSTLASGASSHSEGNGTRATGENAHAEGTLSRAEGRSAHAEGYGTKAIGKDSHTEGQSTRAIGDQSHAEGVFSEAFGDYSHAEGYDTRAIGFVSHAQNRETVASGNYTHAGGHGTEANVHCGTAIGRYNLPMSGQVNQVVSTDDLFVIGGGTVSTAKSNAFRVTGDGRTYGKSAFNSTGADYAEYFEWLDGNPKAEERQGYFVTMDGDKIRKATSGDEYIVGIISVNPSVVGDSYQDDWNNRYVTDEWGRIQYEWIDVQAVLDEDNNIVEEARRDYVPMPNPEYNYEEEYVPREKRPEWSPVGIVGKLLVRDDGTCKSNGFCKSNDDGIATSSETGYRVMERVSPNIVRVFVK